jgi:hypothetical protein
VKIYVRSSNCFLKRIVDSSPSGYYMLEAQAATPTCLVVVLLAILKKIKESIWLFSPWRGGVFGYFNFDKV